MVHECNIHCHSIDPDQSELMGLNEDPGKWMPFAFNMDIVAAMKLTNDDIEELTYNCTTIFTDYGDTYIIDTAFDEFVELYKSFVSKMEKKDNVNL